MSVRRHRSWRRGDGGQTTAMVVIAIAGLFLFAGLVLDGGLALAGKVAAADAAQEAARSGSQQIDLAYLRATQRIRLDRQRAAAAARDYVQATGNSGRVHTDGDTVTVTVTHRQRTQILSLVGIRELATTAEATARPERGITTPWTRQEPRP
ncbi:pilus assembly protein TadG-related protein [Actinacidiphila sp. bgisy167]|uniref:pilus assembly protein TadG-related protein n=1 Tax=Actinacidiphila sp. bgisy167 TaxID=3413797 RepID=UPI003D7320D0